MLSGSKRNKGKSGVGHLLKSVFKRANTTDSRSEVTIEEPAPMDVGTLVNVRIEPDSEETKSQSLLGARDIKVPVFTIGRRSGSVGQKPSESSFSIRQVEPYTMSRQHCELELHDGFVIIRDLGGMYGTLVNDIRIGGRSDNERSMKIESGTHTLVLGPRNSTMRFKLIVQ